MKTLPHSVSPTHQQSAPDSMDAGMFSPQPGMRSAMPPDDGQAAQRQAAANNSPQVRQLMQLQAGANGQAPIQRKVDWSREADEHDETEETAIRNVTARLDGYVQQARRMALDWRNCLNHNSKQVTNWAKCAQQYAQDKKSNSQLSMFFGTAVEHLSCHMLNNSEDGLQVKLQVSKGTTIPDVVLCNKSGKEVAWLDVTASNSRTHIDNKVGSGWRTTPFVAEILYDSLDLNEILTGSDNPVFNEIGKYEFKKQELKQEAFEFHLDAFQRDFEEQKKKITWPNSQKDRQKKTKEIFGQLGFEQGLTSNIGSKGAISMMDMNFNDHGMKKGKQSGEMFKSFINQESMDSFKVLESELNKEKMSENKEFIDRHRYSGMGKELVGLDGFHELQRVQETLAYKIADQLLEKLRVLYGALAKHQKPYNLGDLITNLLKAIFAYPDKLDINALAEWVKKTQALVEYAEQAWQVVSKDLKEDNDNSEDKMEEEEFFSEKNFNEEDEENVSTTEEDTIDEDTMNEE